MTRPPACALFLLTTVIALGAASIATGDTTDTLRVAPQPVRLLDPVIVTAARGGSRLSTPAGTTVLTSRALLASPAGALDDALRSTPGFSLFRRSSSRVANPTTQGVTLRGLSASGASRTLVLGDGIPLNDPFGSWVAWNRVPLAAIDRVEVVRGGPGDLYGADALGGVIQVLTLPSDTPRARLIADQASRGTSRVSGFGSAARGGWSGALAGEGERSDGALVAAPEVRGPVDVPALGNWGTGFATLGFDRGGLEARVHAGGYDEDRNNGTPLQVNHTRWRQASAGLRDAGPAGGWQLNAALGDQRYRQTFSAIAADRASERLTSAQDIPTDFASASGQWERNGRAGALLVGGEWNRARSTVNETRYSPAGVASGPFLSGGDQHNAAAFGRLALGIGSNVTLVLGARGDAWRSTPRADSLEAHTLAFFSPRASLAWRMTQTVSLQASAYRAWRTPTLNELYRGFRAGNVVTNPNPGLDPERLTGAEAGALLTLPHGAARVTAFVQRLDQAITNVTLSSTPALTTRERRNTDQVRADGVEVEAELTAGRWTLGGAAALMRARVVHAPENPVLEGLRVPQVPETQLAGSLRYGALDAWNLGVEARSTGLAFDDDLNQLPLHAFVVLDASAALPLRRGVDLVAAGENLLDEDYDVARTPTRAIGWPRTLRVGVRIGTR